MRNFSSVYHRHISTKIGLSRFRIGRKSKEKPLSPTHLFTFLKSSLYTALFHSTLFLHSPFFSLCLFTVLGGNRTGCSLCRVVCFYSWLFGDTFATAPSYWNRPLVLCARVLAYSVARLRRADASRAFHFFFFNI